MTGSEVMRWPSLGATTDPYLVAHVWCTHDAPLMHPWCTSVRDPSEGYIETYMWVYATLSEVYQGLFDDISLGPIL